MHRNVSIFFRCALLCIFCLATPLACTTDDNEPVVNTKATHEFDGEEARAWMDVILSRIQADSYSPPVAARTLAYTGVLTYEAVVDGMENHQSLGGQLNDLDLMPPLNGEAYDFASVLHGALGHLTPTLFSDTESRQVLRDFAEDHIEKRREQGVDDAVITRSVNRGVLLAEVIDSWAKNDGYYTRNEREFIPPTGSHTWVPTVADQEPLEPYWGDLRTFAMPEADACKPPPPATFSTEPGSTFHQEAFAVWLATEEATDDERHIAHFWADNPGETPTPPGHWMGIATQMVDDLQMNLADTAELFALLGVAAADSFISCWDEKYRSYLIRPITYIQNHIDPEWETIIATPPFPEYTSGHSNVSGASATVLTELLGEVSFENRFHEGREMGTRHFDHFHHAAQESALSRLYGGIHYPMGIDHGVPQGHCVADFVLQRLKTRVK